MIAIDQPHNQNITVIKAYRGTIGLTEDKYKAFFQTYEQRNADTLIMDDTTMINV